MPRRHLGQSTNKEAIFTKGIVLVNDIKNRVKKAVQWGVMSNIIGGKILLLLEEIETLIKTEELPATSYVLEESLNSMSDTSENSAETEFIDSDISM